MQLPWTKAIQAYSPSGSIMITASYTRERKKALKSKTSKEILTRSAFLSKMDTDNLREMSTILKETHPDLPLSYQHLFLDAVEFAGAR